MLIDYYLASTGYRVVYDTGGCELCASDICNIAMLWAQANPVDLPDSAFIHVSVYSNFVKMMNVPATSVPVGAVPQFMQIWTGCGPLRVYPLPFGWTGPQVIVGKQEDYDEYDIDKVFEKVVLRDCERE